jgi:hypothetical protein
MLHTLLASALVSAAAHVTPVVPSVTLPGVLLDTAVAAPVAKHLVLDLRSGGSVRLVGGQEKVGRIRVTDGGRACGDCGVQLDQSTDGIKVRSARPAGGSSNLQFEIEVPEQFDLDVSSAGGEVNIEGVTGTIKGSTESGALQLRRLSGSVDMETKRGDVSLRESYVSGRVHTAGGRVVLEDVSGSVAGTTVKGKVIERRVQRG